MDDLTKRSAKAQIKAYYVSVAGLLLLVYQLVQPSASLLPNILPPTTTWLPTVLLVVGVVIGGVFHLLAARLQKSNDSTRQEQSPTPLPSVQIIRHKDARKHNDAIFHEVFALFQKAGWAVVSGNTDLPEHEQGIRVAGKAGFDAEAVKFASFSSNHWSEESGQITSQMPDPKVSLNCPLRGEPLTYLRRRARPTSTGASVMAG